MTLEELLTALRAAPGPSRGLDAEIAVINGYVFVRESNGNKLYLRPGQDPNEAQFNCYLQDRLPMFTSSIDAAAAFREQMLPGWHWEIGGDGSAMVRDPSIDWSASADFCEWPKDYVKPCPIRALVAAVVAGVIAKEGKT
jgi:hypothetical protein